MNPDAHGFALFVVGQSGVDVVVGVSDIDELEDCVGVSDGGRLSRELIAEIEVGGGFQTRPSDGGRLSGELIAKIEEG